MQTYWFNGTKWASGGMGAAKWTYRCTVFLPSRSSAGLIWNTKIFCPCFEQYQEHPQNLLISRGLEVYVCGYRKPLSCHQNTTAPPMGQTHALSSRTHRWWSYQGNTGWPDSSTSMLHIQRVTEVLRLANGQKGFIFMGFWSLLDFWLLCFLL